MISPRIYRPAGSAAFAALCALIVPPLHSEQPSAGKSNFQLAGSLDNCRLQFERKKIGHVVFMGGSITEMEGYRPMVCQDLARRFPETKFTFTNAGISSTCSTTGAFRLEKDVLSAGPVDLLFLEFAVNDDQDAAHGERECIRGMEGIVRHLRKHNPNADVVITYFVNEGMLATSGKQAVPLTIAAHEKVAGHYGISTINLAREVFEQMRSGKLTWQQFGGVHPAPHGNRICADMIKDLLAQAWSKPPAADAIPAPHELPTALDEFNYEHGRFIDPALAKIQQGWKLYQPDWKNLKGSSRDRFTSMPMLCTEQAGGELTLEFEGAAVGAYIVAGPDAGIVEAKLDDQPPAEFNLYHRFSAGLHYPRTVMFATDLKPGRHMLKLRMTDKTKSTGNAMRIMRFVAN